MKKKHLSCKLGFHNWHYDSRLWIAVKECTKCNKIGTKNPKVLEDLKREKELWKLAKEKGMSPREAKEFVFNELGKSQWPTSIAAAHTPEN
ncbi:MAG: hypothetical protein R3251_02015 [Candidatus Spechtbacterales bacterium]|nr:hypothetical protein [Candidatus Spechtbacterales bacterium]